MANQQLKTDIRTLPKEDQELLEQALRDSRALRSVIDDDGVKHWRLFYRLGMAVMHYMSTDAYCTSTSKDEEAMDFTLIFRRLGYLVEHVENSEE